MPQRLDIQPLDIQPLGQLDIQPLDIQPLEQSRALVSPTPEAPKKGFLSRTWEKLNTPIFGSDPNKPTGGISEIPGVLMDIGRNLISNPRETALPMLGGFASGAVSGARDLATPINIADAATGFGKAPLMRALNRGVSAATVGGGIQDLSEGNISQGIAEIAGGAIGLRPGSRTLTREAIAPKVETPVVKPEVPVQGKLEIEPVGQVDEVVPSVPPTEKLLDALRESKPLNVEQRKLYKQERGERIRAAQDQSQSLTGSAYAKSYLGALKGEYDKVKITPPKLEQMDVENLLTTIKDAKGITGFERANALGSLPRLLEGQVPTDSEIKVLSRIFGDDLTTILKDRMPLADKVGSILHETVNLPRALMATMDFSAPLRQGLPLIHRGEWWGSLKPMFKSAWDEKNFKEVNDIIRNKPTFERQQEAGLALSDLADMSNREERLMSTWAEQGIPLGKLGKKLGSSTLEKGGDALQGAYAKSGGRLVRGSNRAYTAFLNKLRSDTFDSLTSDAAKASGGTIDPLVDDEIAAFINNATGRGSLKFGPVNLERHATTLNSTLFSPRLQASRVKLINQTLNPYEYYKATPVVRKEALKTLFSIVGVGGTLATLAAMSGAGETTLDSNSSDFGKIKIGDVRIDPYAGFQQYAVLTDRLMRGETTSPVSGKTREFGTGFTDPTRLSVLQNFGESKAHPTLGLAINLLRGTNYAGQPIELKNEMLQRSAPILLQDLVELADEDPALAGFLIPALFGMGVSKYGSN